MYKYILFFALICCVDLQAMQMHQQVIQKTPVIVCMFSTQIKRKKCGKELETLGQLKRHLRNDHAVPIDPSRDLTHYYVMK